MDSVRKGQRVEICSHCRRKWPVSKLLVIKKGEFYECPDCEKKRKVREAK